MGILKQFLRTGAPTFLKFVFMKHDCKSYSIICLVRQRALRTPSQGIFTLFQTFWNNSIQLLRATQKRCVYFVCKQCSDLEKVSILTTTSVSRNSSRFYLRTYCQHGKLTTKTSCLKRALQIKDIISKCS